MSGPVNKTEELMQKNVFFAELPEGAQPAAPIALDGDQTLDLVPRDGAGFTHDCFAR